MARRHQRASESVVCLGKIVMVDSTTTREGIKLVEGGKGVGEDSG